MNTRHDDQAEDLPLHPTLERVARSHRVASKIVAFTGVALAITFVCFILAMRYTGHVMPLVLTLVVLPPLVLILFLSWYLRTAMLPRLHAANRLLHANQPRPVHVTPTGAGDFTGQLVEIADPDNKDAPWGLASVMSTHKRTMNRKPLDADMYWDRADPERHLVLVSGKVVMTGRLATPEGLSKSWRNFRLFLMAMFVVIGLTLGAMAWTQMKAMAEASVELEFAQASVEWPFARGEILSSEVVETRIKRGKTSVQAWETVITYDYVVDGQEHEGRRIYFGYRPARDYDEALALAEAYPPGAAVDAAYDPDNPAASVLEPGHEEVAAEQLARAKRQMLLSGMMSLAGLTFMLMMGVFQYRRRKSSLERVFHLADARDLTS